MSELLEGWVKNRLDQVSDVVDCEHKTASTVDGSEYYSIRTTDIKNGKLNYAIANRVSKETYKKWIKRAVPKAGDIILAREAPVGEVGWIDDGYTVCLGQRTVLIKVKSKQVYRKFLLYYLTSRKPKHDFKVLSTGSVVQHLNMKDIREYKIAYPTYIEQKAIANILSSFDEKIELLRAQNKILETLAQTIFKEWFVNFNYPGATGEMVDSELGEIPKGWWVGGIRFLVKHIKKNIKPFEFPDKKYQHYSIPAFDSGKNPDKHNGREISSNKYLVVENCFLVSKLNPATPRVWVVFKTQGHFVCSTEFQVIKPINCETFGFIYGALTSYMMIHELSARAHGTSSSHQRVKPEDILDCPVFLPSDDLVKSYSEVSSKILKKIDNNLTQIQTLAKTRDTLLPKLMSGEIRVSL
ncbi:MAG: restriction endonuclease subunit S [Deltaproteobacteria bacterium]|nr:restriction endonuclease subunit S [Candidatus Tharpella aukensis]